MRFYIFCCFSIQVISVVSFYIKRNSSQVNNEWKVISKSSNHFEVLSTHIVNGQPAYKGQFPFQAAIQLDGSKFCSGSLVSTKYILSAASCVVNTTTLFVYLGTITLEPLDTGCITTISRSILIHEEFDISVFKNDISLVELLTDIPLTYYVQRVYLPTYSDQDELFEGQDVLLSGWGLTDVDFRVQLLSNCLRFIETSVVSNEFCESVYGEAFVTPSILCTSGEGGMGSCMGDSGGGLVINTEGYYTQIGVAIYSGTTCSNGSPSGFTRVTSYLKWIEENSDIIIQENVYNITNTMN